MDDHAYRPLGTHTWTPDLISEEYYTYCHFGVLFLATTGTLLVEILGRRQRSIVSNHQS